MTTKYEYGDRVVLKDGTRGKVVFVYGVEHRAMVMTDDNALVENVAYTEMRKEKANV